MITAWKCLNCLICFKTCQTDCAFLRCVFDFYSWCVNGQTLIIHSSVTNAIGVNRFNNNELMRVSILVLRERVTNMQYPFRICEYSLTIDRPSTLIDNLQTHFLGTIWYDSPKLIATKHSPIGGGKILLVRGAQHKVPIRARVET